MLSDALINFVPVGAPVSMANLAAGAAVASQVYDILGSGVGTPPANIIGNAAAFGSDVGIGTMRPQVDCVVGDAFTTGSGATLNVQFQASEEDATTHQPTGWVTLIETGEIAVANLTAESIVARFDFPPVYPEDLRPRYLRLNFVSSAGDTFTAGTIDFAIVVIYRDDQANKQAASNFVV